MKTIKQFKKLKPQLIRLIGYEALGNRETVLSDVDSEAREKLRTQVLETVRATHFEELIALMAAAGIINIELGNLNHKTDGFAAFKAIDFYETDDGFAIQAGDVTNFHYGADHTLPKAITKCLMSAALLRKAA
jgi:hypothetical protein